MHIKTICEEFYHIRILKENQVKWCTEMKEMSFLRDDLL